MNFSDYRISLDIHEIGYQHSLTVKRRDTRRRIFASFVEDSKPYIFSEDCRAVFTASKPDGNIVFNDCTIENNVICYHVTEQTVIVPGQVKCEFRLYGDDNALLTSSRFSLLVDDTVYDDDDIVESVTEVSTLTRLVGEATDLIAEVNASLDNGDFIPKLSVGSVVTLSAGSNATVEITGSADAPVLNFGIPQGEQGQAESLIPDAKLSLDSTKPVQNKVITAALNEKAKTEDVNKSLKEKVDKVDGKGLSANDFTNEDKEKLDGVAAGANKYTLPVAGDALGGVKNGGDISADAKGNMTINSGAVSQTFKGTLLASGWTSTAWGAYQQLTFVGSGIIAYSSAAAANQHVEVGLDTSAFATNENPTAIEADEAWANIFRAIPLNNGVQFNFKEIPTVDIPVYAWVVNK